MKCCLRLSAALLCVLLWGCGDAELKQALPATKETVQQQAPERLKAGGGEEVTFYPTYAYREGMTWKMQLRGWVHQDRPNIQALISHAADQCGGASEYFQARLNDFADDNKKQEHVTVKFDNDGKEYRFPRGSMNGIVELLLELSEETAQQLLGKPASADGWLTYRATSSDHTGLGRVRLIAPDPNGISVISDIDDTIKITDIPAGKATVTENTFCREFAYDPAMQKKYQAWGDLPIHYVSGGPTQMFVPLYDYLITGPGHFPEGTFHLKLYSTNLLSTVTDPTGKRLIAQALKLTTETTLDLTYEHKIKEITTILDRFPERTFILVGDSGEVDPEVYREVKQRLHQRRPTQHIQAIIIRDIINDQAVNPYRLQDMEPVAVPPVCIEEKHFQHLARFVQKMHPGQQFRKNTGQCSQKPPGAAALH